MAAPRQRSVEPLAVAEEKGDKPTVEIKEEVTLIAMYKEMLGKIDEINKLSLGVESSDDLAAMLKETEGVKAKIQSVIEKLTMQMEMDKVVEAFEGSESNG